MLLIAAMPSPDDRYRRRRGPSAGDKVRDILRRNPDLPKAGVAKYAGVSSRTVERVIGATG